MATYYLEVDFRSDGAKGDRVTIEYGIQYKQDSTNFLKVLNVNLEDGKYKFTIETDKDQIASYFLVGQVNFIKKRQFKPMVLSSLSIKKESPTKIEF